MNRHDPLKCCIEDGILTIRIGVEVLAKAVKLNPDLTDYDEQTGEMARSPDLETSRGGRVKPDGITCIWDEPKPHLIRYLNKSNALLVEAGEEDGKYIDVDAVNQ